MKIARFLPLVVGSAAAILASIASPAKAVVFNLNPTALAGSGLTATGTATINDSVLIPNQNIFFQPTSTGLDGFSFNVSNGESFDLSSVNQWLLATDNTGAITDLNFLTNAGSIGGTLAGVTSFTADYLPASGPGETFQFAPTAATPVPFETGDATIPIAVSSLIALGALKKAKQTIALKTCVANSVKTIVS